MFEVDRPTLQLSHGSILPQVPVGSGRGGRGRFRVLPGPHDPSPDYRRNPLMGLMVFTYRFNNGSLVQGRGI